MSSWSSAPHWRSVLVVAARVEDALAAEDAQVHGLDLRLVVPKWNRPGPIPNGDDVTAATARPKDVWPTARIGPPTTVADRRSSASTARRT